MITGQGGVLYDLGRWPSVSLHIVHKSPSPSGHKNRRWTSPQGWYTLTLYLPSFIDNTEFRVSKNDKYHSISSLKFTNKYIYIKSRQYQQSDPSSRYLKEWSSKTSRIRIRIQYPDRGPKETKGLHSLLSEIYSWFLR